MYTDLRAAVINYLDDKVPVPMVKQGPSISTTKMVQALRTGDQREDEETKNEVTPDENFAMIPQFKKGKGKGKGKGKKGTCWNCPHDKQDNSWTDGGIWKNQKGGKASKRCKPRMGRKQEQLEQLRETVRAKAKTGTGMANPKRGKVRTDRKPGARQHGMARAARKALARAALTKLVTSTGRRSQTDHSPAHNEQSAESTR